VEFPVEDKARRARIQPQRVISCDDSSTSGFWTEESPEGLLARLLADDPPNGFEKVIDGSGGRVFAVASPDF
jgi:hypothetical protein